jgi:N-acetylglucosamine-6-phosphate deacetylase
MATINPARILKMADRKGSLEVGKDADCVVLDENFNVIQTLVAGKVYK